MVRRVLVVAVVALGACGGDDATIPTVTPTTTPAPTTTVRSAAVVPTDFDQVPMSVVNTDGTVCELCVWQARTDAERRRGLMGVTDLGTADGMAFVYDAPVTNRYWMRDTPLTLDIAWFDPDGTLLSTAVMRPCLTGPADDCARYGPDAPYTLALEVTAGRLAELGIGPGSVAELGVGAGCDTP